MRKINFELIMDDNYSYFLLKNDDCYQYFNKSKKILYKMKGAEHILVYEGIIHDEQQLLQLENKIFTDES